MKSLPSPAITLALTVALSATPAAVWASSVPFNSVVVYGDSLSDNGNLFAATGQPGPPYFDGRMSNGPVTVEQLASNLGAPLEDFAWIGATTGIGNDADHGTVTTPGAFSLPGMQVELAATQASLGPFLSNGLFVVWGGPNDFLAPSPLDTTPGEIIARGVGDLVGIVNMLRGLGAQHILVPGMPDLGLTPAAIEGTLPFPAPELSAVTNAFNTDLRASLPAGVAYYDTASLIRNIVADPSSFGLTNVTDPCLVGTTVCADPNDYLFWDTFHPTTAADAIAAKAFQEAVVPEPATIVPVAFALCLVLTKRLRS